MGSYGWLLPWLKGDDDMEISAEITGMCATNMPYSLHVSISMSMTKIIYSFLFREIFVIPVD